MAALPQVTIMHQRNSLQILTPCYIQTDFNTNHQSTLIASLTPRTLRSVHIGPVPLHDLYFPQANTDNADGGKDSLTAFHFKILKKGAEPGVLLVRHQV
jgi:hypothetical protein